MSNKAYSKSVKTDLADFKTKMKKARKGANKLFPKKKVSHKGSRRLFSV